VVISLLGAAWHGVARGLIGFLRAARSPSSGGTVDIAGMVFREHRGRGLESALVAVAMTAPEFVHAWDVVGCVEPDNQPAQRVLRRAGFVEEGGEGDGFVVYRYSVAASHARRT